MMFLNEQVRKTQLRKGIYYYFLPEYSQAKRVIWDDLVRKHVPAEIVDRRNESELAIYYKNGSIQRFLGCEDPDSHRGSNPIDVVFDEYPLMKESIWTTVIQPVLRENGGTATFGYTPKGQNHAWKLLQAAKDNDSDWHWEIKTVYDTLAISPEEIEKARKEMPEAMFRQEFLCEFLDNAGAFFSRVSENIVHVEPQPHPDHQYQLGIDLAKYQDWTVITPFDLNTFQVLPQERFNRVDWSFQKSRIEALAHKYNNAIVQIDSTGVGDPITEDLKNAGLRVQANNDRLGFRFTETSRRQLLDHLRILLEQDKIKIPQDGGLVDELKSMSFVIGQQGSLKVQVPEGLHDDRIMSLALSVWGQEKPKHLGKQDDYQLYVTEFS